jgi:hypothetical protein
MKKLLFIYFALTITILAQFGSPKIVSMEEYFDFGDIEEGEIVEHDFVIFNRGTDVLEISRVKASCGCTAVTPSKTRLIPDDSTQIKVKFNSTRRIGKQKKYVYIFSNDPNQAQLRLSFQANVISEDETNKIDKPSIQLSQYNHNFGNVTEGEKLEAFIEVKNIGTSQLNIEQIKSSCGCTAALMSTKKLLPNESDKLKIIFDTKNLSGQVARTVTLFSNDSEHPTRVLTLIANIEKE